MIGSILFGLFGFLIGFFVVKGKEQRDNSDLEAERKRLSFEIDKQNNQLELLKDNAESRAEEFYNNEIRIAMSEIELEKSKMSRALEDYIKSCQTQKFKADENLKCDVDLINQEKQRVLEEVNDLKAKRASLVEAQKKQEELESKKDFYRIQLKQSDIDDIEVLLPLGAKLHSPDILYKLIWSTYYLNEVNNLCARVLPKKEISGIYKITNISNGKVYIGRSVDIAERWKQHIKSYLGIGTIAKTQLYDAMRKDGGWNYTFELLEEAPKDKLSEREKYYINFFGTNSFGYNCNSGG